MTFSHSYSGACDGGDLDTLVTIVIVTSPIASNPNTEMFDRCMNGIFRSFPPLRNCPIIAACDGVQIIEESSNSKKSGATKRIFGKCTRDNYERYDRFCQELASRCWLQVDRQSEWQGFALTLRSALKLVKTPVVMVLPHDYELMPDVLSAIDLRSVIHEMIETSDINYIGLPNPQSFKMRLRHSTALINLEGRNMISEGIRLEPLVMWKENPHFAKVEAYRTIVFSHRFKRGQFIEDTLGQEMLAAIKERGNEAFYNLYLLSMEEPCSFHMDGPRYLPIDEKRKRGYAIQVFEIEAAKQAEDLSGTGAKAITTGMTK